MSGTRPAVRAEAPARKAACKSASSNAAAMRSRIRSASASTSTERKSVVSMVHVAPLTGTDPWHRQRGWVALASDVRTLLGQHPDAALLASDRKIAAQMMFYVRPHPWDMVKWNPDGHIGDHYELTSSMASLKGRPALFLTRAEHPAGLEELFTSITPLPSVARLRPWVRPREAIYRHLESPGTKAYTLAEARALFSAFAEVDVDTALLAGDLLAMRPSARYQGALARAAWRLYPRGLIRRFGRRLGLGLLVRARKA